jgi:2-polyprenyl-3-methyl-5-hydroxy-6-metoxy-1,4-benzoquinol methylase
MQTKGKIRIGFKGTTPFASFSEKEIITGRGFFTAINIDNREILSGDLLTRTFKKDVDEIYQAGFSTELNLYQILKVKKKSEEIEISANLFIKQAFKHFFLEISLELAGDYLEFTDSFVYRKAKDGEGLLFEGWPALRYIGARGEGVPSLYFFVPEGVWYNSAKLKSSDDRRIILSFVIEITGGGKSRRKNLINFAAKVLINKKNGFAPCYNEEALEFYRKNFPYGNWTQKEGNLSVSERLSREEELLRKQLPAFVSEKEIEFFNTQVKDPDVRANYLNYVTSRRERAFYVLKRVYPLVSDFCQKKILDFGASHGAFSNFLYSNGVKITGFDIFLSNIAKVEGKAQLSQARGEELPYKNNSFDLVILWDIIEHLWTENAQEKAFAEINRVLKPGGFCIISAPNKLWPWDDEAFLFGIRYLPKSIADWYVKVRKKAADIEDRKGGYEFKMRTFRGYKSLFSDTGFSIISTEMEKFVIFGAFQRFARIIHYLARKNLNLYPGYLFCLKKERGLFEA